MDGAILKPDAIEPEIIEEPVLSDEDLIAEIVFQMLLGVGNATKMAREIGIPTQRNRVQALMKSQEVQRLAFKARRNLASSTIERIQRMLPRFEQEMEKIALESDDTRSKVVALKDLMDRGGAGATQKLAVTGPEAYRKAVEDLVESE